MPLELPWQNFAGLRYAAARAKHRAAPYFLLPSATMTLPPHVPEPELAGPSMEELEAAFRQAGKGTAPGVSGITCRQWEEGPPRAKRLTLIIFNKMLETATVPRIFRLGRICPIPKDVPKPVTESNARAAHGHKRDLF